jgi:hypothetical protein
MSETTQRSRSRSIFSLLKLFVCSMQVLGKRRRSACKKKRNRALKISSMTLRFIFSIFVLFGWGLGIHDSLLPHLLQNDNNSYATIRFESPKVGLISCPSDHLSNICLCPCGSGPPTLRIGAEWKLQLDWARGRQTGASVALLIIVLSSELSRCYFQQSLSPLSIHSAL